MNAKKINDRIIQDLVGIDCLIIDSFENNIEEKIALFNIKSVKAIRKFCIN